MKYTKQQKDYLKFKKQLRFRTKKITLPKIKIENGYYIIESKINFIN